MSAPDRPLCLFSIDVEDWFHILDLPSTPPLSQWGSLPSRVEKNFGHLLALLAEYDVKATCFFLGWVAEKYPHLVQEAVAAGHEIASHGYAHELAFRIGREKFTEDAVRSRKLLEDISGLPVRGYRATGFSVTEDTPWFFDGLIEAGYVYDSSVFPMTRGHGGMTTASVAPHVVASGTGTIVEIPITTARFLGRRVCAFGGGYLRLSPLWLIERLATQVNADGRPVTIYVHPREVDPDHPRLPMPLVRRFKSYVNLQSTEPKLRRLLDSCTFVRYDQYVASHDLPLNQVAR